MKNYFDPREYIRGLQQIFISDSKRIGFLNGAGTSFALKNGSSDKSRIPGIEVMTERIVATISTKHTNFKGPLENVIKELKDNNLTPTIEQILSNITQKQAILGREKLLNLNKLEWNNLKNEIESEIKDLVSVHKHKNDFVKNFVQGDFALWIKNSGRKDAVEIFTTNYDYLFEIGLEHNNVPYYDGFIGSYYPFFYPSSVEDMSFLPGLTKLWKLHGSLGWQYDEESRKIIRSLPDDSNIMVYPSLMKYDNSKKQPYVSFIDRLSNFIKKDDGVLFISGYSFGDFHINDVIINALEKADTSHVVVFLYDKVVRDDEPYYMLNEECDIRNVAISNKRISVYGMNSAIIGGKYGLWKLKDKTLNDEDAVLLDLFFEDSYSEEGIVPKRIFSRYDSISYEESKEIWTVLKDNSIIDGNGVLQKDYSTILESLTLDSKYNGMTDDIKALIRKQEAWSGEGEFLLPDFAKFVNFLHNLNSDDFIKKTGMTNGTK